MARPQTQATGGLPMALGAYVMWGLLPLYLRLVHNVPPFEFVGWRIIFTLPLCLIFIALRRQGRDLRLALGNPKILAVMGLSAMLIGGNWLVYVMAIQQGHIFAASLGYYINPLVNVLLGTLFLGERLSRRQWLAVGLATGGVLLLVWDAREMQGISLVLAGSFSLYGLVRKLAPIGSLPGLTIESAILLPPAIAFVTVAANSPAGPSFGHEWTTSLLIACAGVLTAVPLLMFAVAARRMDYSTLGFVQFLSPTIVFFLGLFVFHEPLKPVQLACFIVIWCAIAVFSWDLLARRRKS